MPTHQQPLPREANKQSPNNRAPQTRPSRTSPNNIRPRINHFAQSPPANPPPPGYTTPDSCGAQLRCAGSGSARPPRSAPGRYRQRQLPKPSPPSNQWQSATTEPRPPGSGLGQGNRQGREGGEHRPVAVRVPGSKPVHARGLHAQLPGPSAPNQTFRNVSSSCWNHTNRPNRGQSMFQNVSNRFIRPQQPPKTARTDPSKPNPCCKMLQDVARQAKSAKQTQPAAASGPPHLFLRRPQPALDRRAWTERLHEPAGELDWPHEVCPR